jgi:pimeloyl-ACP methyl ester carboxylesterase
MAELECYELPAGPDAARSAPLRLYRLANPGRPPVLLLHGASASHETFLFPVPRLDGSPRSLAGWLHAMGYEPWLLDWRGSSAVVDQILRSGDPSVLRDQLDFDQAAEFDVPAAVACIGRHTEGASISVIGHCMGGGVLAQAIASGRLERTTISHVVLLTVGLFYEPPIDSRLKSQDYILELLLFRNPEMLSIDPRDSGSWPPELEEMYRNWTPALRPHTGGANSPVHDLCNRLSFMYGPPYLECRLLPHVHAAACLLSYASGGREPKLGETVDGDASGATGVVHDHRLDSGSWSRGSAQGRFVLSPVQGEFRAGEALRIGAETVATAVSKLWETPAELRRQFGALPLRMYVQGARNVRRGWAGRFDAALDDDSLIRPECRDRFHQLRQVTLVSGERNQLWHRNSIDRMSEWLARGRPPRRHRRVIVRGYGHQDLLWGRTATEDVFRAIAAGLPAP